MGSCEGVLGAAHPRSRGENGMLERLLGPRAGSSPLTRGKHVGWLSEDGMGRLIPAHAGKTVDDGDQAIPRTAHPRSRGENGRLDDTKHTLTGSSPLTRGKRPRHPRPLPELRLIPAHAGKTRGRGSSA